MAEEEGAGANAIAEIGAAGLHALLLADAGRWDEAEALTISAVRRVEESGFSWAPFVTALLAHTRMLAHHGDPQADERAAAIGALLERAAMPPWMSLLAEVLLAELLWSAATRPARPAGCAPASPHSPSGPTPASCATAGAVARAA